MKIPKCITAIDLIFLRRLGKQVFYNPTSFDFKVLSSRYLTVCHTNDTTAMLPYVDNVRGKLDMMRIVLRRKSKRKTSVAPLLAAFGGR